MAETRQHATWVQTAAAIRPVLSCASFLLIVFLCAGSPQGADSQKVLDSIAAQLDQGNFALALEPAKKAWTESAAGSEFRWKFQLRYAQVLLFNGRWQDAEALLKQAPPPQYAALLPRFQYLKSFILFKRGEAVQAQVLAQNAIAGANAAHDADTETETLLLLANPNYVKDSRRTRAAAQQAWHAARTHGLPAREAAALLNLGFDALKQEHCGDAIPYFQQAVPLAEKVKAHYIHVVSLSNLGECYYTLGDFDRAFRTLSQARPQLRSSDVDAKFYVNYELGSLYLLRQQLPDAIASFSEAASYADPVKASNLYVMATVEKADALLRRGSVDEAQRSNQQAQAVFATAKNPDGGLQSSIDLNNAAIAAARGEFASAAASYRKVIRSQGQVPVNSVQWSAYSGLASVQEKLGQWQAAKRSFGLALSAIEKGRSVQKQAEYQITYLSALIRFYQDYVDLLLKEHEETTALAVADSSRASVLTEGRIGSRELPNFSSRLQSLARSSKSVILFYWLAEKTSCLWAVTPAGTRLLPLGDAGEISRDVQSYSRFIQTERQDTLAVSNPVGKRLYHRLLSPVADFIPAGSRVIIVPDGPLHNLNFETLLVDKPKPHYWLDDVTVTIAPSLGILLQTYAPAKSAPKEALLFGNPVYNGPDFPRLPQSAEELESVRKHFAGSSTLITKGSAQPTAYQKAHPGRFTTIHFSAHVEASAQSPLDSAIILSPGDSGVRLYARDVAGIPLTADLVTVSGCWGAGSKTLSGEGLVGFAWAAFYAGAHNAVTSLWAVDDRSTAELMDTFYAKVGEGKPYAAALREAKLSTLKSYRRPYYWAPFQLYSRSIAAN